MAYEVYRQNRIEQGLLYQDFVVDLLLHTLGLAVVQYASRVYQTQIGESRTGVEIKYQDMYKKTGNLWIETAEKARPRPGDYVPSGISNRAHDNAWLFVTGDYDTVFGFPKRLLQALDASGRYPQRENNTQTSVGYLLPDGHARKYAAFVLRPQANQKVEKAVQDLQALGRLLHQEVLGNRAQASLFDEPDTAA